MDNLLLIFKYFAKFVPLEIFQKEYVKANTEKDKGYSELLAEILREYSDSRITEIEKYIFSANSKFVEDNIRNTHEIFLFVEYGSAEILQITGRQKLAITVAKEYSQRNNDNLSELITVNNCRNILNKIVQTLVEDFSNDCAFCGDLALPINLVPVEPTEFFGLTGYTAYIDVEIPN